ncbi:MAG: hypothetical protein ACXQS5_06720 [Candidatus Methanospirareceae archaeon]
MFSTGSKKLDEIFGGYEASTIHLFYGPAGAGKTHLAVYQPILSLAKYMTDTNTLEENHRFIIVSTDGGFSRNRLQQVLQYNGVDVYKVLPKLVVFEPTSFDSQHDVIINQIPKLIEVSGIKPLLIAVDPITAHYRVEYFKASPRDRLQTALRGIGRIEVETNLLFKIAKETGAVVTITTWYKSYITDQIKRAWYSDIGGGKALAYYPTKALRLELIAEYPKKIKATVVKHRFGEEYKTCEFTIKHSGVSD